MEVGTPGVMLLEQKAKDYVPSRGERNMLCSDFMELRVSRLGWP